MDIKEVTVTVQLPKKFESLDQLEMAIHTEGQRIKQQLFTEAFQAIIDNQKENASEEPIACPHWQKGRIFFGSKLRQLKTLFGEIHLPIAIQPVFAWTENFGHGISYGRM